MRYRVLEPATPNDPRMHTYASTAELETFWRPGMEGDTETYTATIVRSKWPDAVAMPVVFQIGSGDVFMLGLVESIHAAAPARAASDPGAVIIPFVALVQAVPERAGDKKDIDRRRQFTARHWRVPAVMPRQIDHTWRRVEVRTGELDNPVVVDLVQGADHRGRQMFYFEIGGVPCSLTLDNPNPGDGADDDVERSLHLVIE